MNISYKWLLFLMGVLGIAFGVVSAQAKNLDVNIDLSQCDNPVCKWSFGDGSNATGCEAKKHSYSEAGDYDVTLAVDCGAFSQVGKRHISVMAKKECTYEGYPNFFDVHYVNEAYNPTAFWDGEKKCVIYSIGQGCFEGGYKYTAGQSVDSRVYKVCREPTDVECRYRTNNEIRQDNPDDDNPDRFKYKWGGDTVCYFYSDEVDDVWECRNNGYRYFRWGNRRDNWFRDYKDVFWYQICREPIE